MALNSVIREDSRGFPATVLNNHLSKEFEGMHSIPGNANQPEPNLQSIPQSTTCYQPWWRGTDPSAVLGESTSKPSSMENPDGRMGTNAGELQGDGGLNEGDGVTKEPQTTIASQSGPDGHYGHEHQHLQHVASTMPPTGGEYLIQRPQFELVGHSIACAPYPYSDPYYTGMMTAFGSQAQVHPHLLGMRHTRMPLPLEMAEEPVYVNAKQYHGILRRRQSRAKAELEKKLIKSRKPYLHESRHQHAMRRARGCGGRFLNTKKLENGAATHTTENGMASDYNGNRNSSSGQQEVKGSTVQEMQEQHSYSNSDNKSCYQHNQGLHLSSFRSPGERGDEGDCSGQQRGSISVNQAPNRALTIQ